MHAHPSDSRVPRRRHVRPLLALAALLLTASLPFDVRAALRNIDPAGIRAHISFLADDLLEGRAPGTRGEMLSARYIASQLERAGVEPLRGSWFQPVPLTGWRADARRQAATFTLGSQRITLRNSSDFVFWLDSGADSAHVRGDVVFVGYGVRAPEYRWDDYKGRDVRGRIVVVLANDPPAPPGAPLIFDGAAMTYYGRYTYKIEEARRQGAAAVLIVHTEQGAGYPWRVVQSSWSGEQLALTPDTADAAPLQLQGWLTYDAARRLLATADLDLAQLYVRAARRDFQPVFTNISATLRSGGATRTLEGRNVVGIVHGRHPQRRNEAVIYTAHHDGLGVGAPVDGDSIYNGAYDNASGVALLLEIAEAFATLTPKPERSIIFLFTTAEEAGMLGATHYTRAPLHPLSRTVAALNIDGANLWGETADVAAVGLERSTLGSVFEQQAAALGLHVSPERAPERGFFFRSDHFPFARAGIPALYFDHGTEFRSRPPGWSDAVLTRFEATRYHLPADEFDPGVDLTGAAQQARHAMMVGLAVANTAARPRIY